MLTLGISLGETRLRKPLKDGGVCAIRDGVVLAAVSEERFSRHKHDGGYRQSLTAVLAHSKLKLEDFDTIGYSTCCEMPSRPDVEGRLAVETDAEIVPVPHHVSHAFSAYHVSPFEQALVMVMDAGGNTLMDGSGPWWQLPREQHSYFVGEGKDITLIGRDFERPFEAGMGEIYRAFTHFLGFESHVNSAHTMALAAYGNPNHFGDVAIFEYKGERLCSRIKNDPPNPVGMVTRFASEYDLDFGLPRKSTDPVLPVHHHVAAFVQREMEVALISKAKRLRELAGIDAVCLAGGVALNCVANSRLLEALENDSLFVQPAAGDQGQCLGNALYAYHEVQDRPRSQSMSHAYLGIPPNLDEPGLGTLLAEAKGRGLRVSFVDDFAAAAAGSLANGLVVAWFQGSSEFGPRALGHRSLLGDPRTAMTRQKLFRIKSRAPFRPLAPSVMEEHCGEFFQFSGKSPFMLLTAKVQANKAHLIPAVCHVDGSARIQTVSSLSNPLFHRLLQRFFELTGIPLVVNTSLNRAGEPLCESPRDAYNMFIETEVDMLFLGPWRFSK